MEDFEVQPTSTVPSVKVTKPNPATKIATPDLILIKDDQLPVDTMSDLIFDDIGGQEIINVARTDLVNGINSSYQLIADIDSATLQYNSTNIIPLPGQSAFYLQNYPINLQSHIPSYDLSLSRHLVTKTVTSVNDTSITTTKNIYIQIINAQPEVISNALTGNVVYTTLKDHGLTIGDTVTVSGIVPTSYNIVDGIVLDIPTRDTFVLENDTTDPYIEPTSSIYFEPYTGDLIIEVDNMLEDEQVEVEIISSSTVFDDTIYIIGD